MNSSRLVEILRAMQVEGMDSGRAWRQVILVRNMAPVPVPSNETPWGFKFIVLDTKGSPSWFGRCGWATPERMRLECELLDWLGNDDVAGRHVPEARFTVVNGDAVQISRHLGVAAYDSAMASRGPQRWLSDLGEILEISELVLKRVQDKHVLQSLSVTFTLSRDEQVQGDCQRLLQNGVDPDVVSRIRDHLQASLHELPTVLQHGDLWPSNILYAEGKWWLIDFSECGLVWTPGYDLLMMLAHAPGGFSTDWIANLANSKMNRWDEARLQAAHAFITRRGWSTHQLGIMVISFLLRITAHRMRPGVAPELAVHWLSELARVDAFLESGHQPSELIRPPVELHSS